MLDHFPSWPNRYVLTFHLGDYLRSYNYPLTSSTVVYQNKDNVYFDQVFKSSRKCTKVLEDQMKFNNETFQWTSSKFINLFP